METTQTLARDVAMLCSGDMGATYPELRQAYTVQEVMQINLILEG